jgi:4-hydroxy-tetrahydrodipicolinate reductase
LKLLLIGHGRMGRLVEAMAASHGCEVAGIVSSRSVPRTIADGVFGPVDVAIDFSTAQAVPATLAELAAARVSVVIGTTGWQDRERDLRRIAERAGIGVLASPNFALGMAAFQDVVGEAARRFAAIPDVGAWIHEAHHSGKRDAPSGTALSLKDAIARAGYDRPVDVSSTRAGSIPGTHTVGFDGPSETVTLTHVVRDRRVFAHGAIEAAKWLKGRTGWYTMKEMIVNLKSR